MNANALQAVKRCFEFIVALYAELEKLNDVKGDEKAYTLGQLKVNLLGYMMNIWKDRKALEADIAAIEQLLVKLKP